MTSRRLPGGRADCGDDDDEDGNRMVKLVRLIKEGCNCTLIHVARGAVGTQSMI